MAEQASVRAESRRERISGIFPALIAPIAQPEIKSAAPENTNAANAARTDEELRLVAAMIANKPSAWRDFQQKYDRLILRCITKVTKRFAAVGQEDVREIYAQLIVSLLANDKNKLRTFDPARGNRFSSWIGLLAIHCAYDHLRGMRREPQKEGLAEACELASDSPDPYELTAQRERADIAARVLAGFSERDRTFAALYFGEGMEPDEIAARMNISVKTVYSKKHKIQTRLESLLGVCPVPA